VMLRHWSLVFTMCVTLFTAVEGAFGHAKVTQNFDKEVSAHFLGSTKRSYVLRKSATEGKPVLVLLTNPGCGACQNLKQSINMGGGVKKLLSEGRVLVVHAQGNKATDEWKEMDHEYVPQTYFFAPGERHPLPIHGTSETSPHFFHDDATLKWGLEKMLEVVRTGQRSNQDL